MTTAGIPALISEARAWASKAVLVGRNVLRDLDRGVAYTRRLADALEATARESHARELHHFETEQAIVEAIEVCDKALAVKVDGSSEGDAAAAGVAAAIRGILAPALSDEHASSLRRAQAEAVNAFADRITRMGVYTFTIHDIRKYAAENEGAGAHD